jgi:protein O-GlcNAc transferase
MTRSGSSRTTVLNGIGCRFRYLVGLAWMRRGKTEQAAAQFRAVVDTCPDFIGARTYLPWTLLELGRLDEAVREYQELVRRAPDYAEGHAGLGVALQRLNRHDEAIAAFRDAIERDPADRLTYHNLGVSLRARGELQDSLVAYRHAVRLKPDDGEAVGNLGATLGELGHWEEAVEFSRKALELKPAFEHAYNLGVGLFELRHFPQAEEAFRTALRLEKDPSDAAIRLALTLCELKRMDEAIVLLDEANRRGTEGGLALSVLSSTFVNAGRITEGLRTARIAVDRYPGLAASHGALGWASLEGATPEAALASFEQALRMAPEDLDYVVGSGVALSLLKRHAAAVEMFNRVEARDPDYFKRYESLAEHVARSRAALR